VRDLSLLAGAVRASVEEAGRIALHYFRRDHARWEKGPGQVVTEADIAVDRYLREDLGKLLPEAGWLSEETADDGSRLTCPLVWVVDPIDGTRSFAEGKPEFTVCVALLEESRPKVGFVLNPATGELFQAMAGDGAFLAGEPIRASSRDTLAGAHIGLSSTERRRGELAARLPQAQVIAIGSLAYKLVLIAAGRLDGYISLRRSKDWDLAAADLILHEAGAVMTDAGGMPIAYDQPEPSRRGLVAAAAGLHGKLLDSLPPLDPSGGRR
jgi:myo-inositol-1(or 4)-monophosphatase